MVADELVKGSPLWLNLREVAASPWEEDLLVTAQPKPGVVDVWSLVRGTRYATFETVWGSGGWRGALVPGEHPVVVAGAWERHGVCGYDLTGQRLWQDRSRTNVEAVTALTGGRVVVTHLRRATRVLEAATGEEVRTLRGALRVIALTSDLTLAAGGGWCRLLDRSLEPVGSRISTGLNTVWIAASDGEHLVIDEPGGPLRVLDSDGRERARMAEHSRHILHDPVTNTWVAVQNSEAGHSLLRFSNEGEVLERRSWDLYVYDAATMRGGRTLILNTEEGVRVVNCADWSVQGLEAT